MNFNNANFEKAFGTFEQLDKLSARNLFFGQVQCGQIFPYK